MTEAPTVVEISCPVCDSAVDLVKKNKAWFALCGSCSTRVYATPATMDRQLKEMIGGEA
jgi:uncharacterized paraquat-inducible protein A